MSDQWPGTPIEAKWPGSPIGETQPPPQEKSDGKAGLTQEPAGFFKSMARGIGRSAMDFLTSQGEAESVAMGQEPGPKPQGGPPRATTTAGKYGEAIGEFAGNPLSYLGPGGLGLKAATAVTGAIGSETAGQLTKDSPYAKIVGGILGGAVGQGAVRAVHPERVSSPAPSLEAIEQSYKSGYKEIANLGFRINPEAVDNLAVSIRDSLQRENFRDFLAPGTYRIIKDELGSGGNKTISDIEAVRQILNKVGGDNKTDRAAASVARDAIDNYLSSIPEPDLITPKGISGVVSKQASELLARTRQDYSSAKQAEKILSAKERAEGQAARTGSGANVANKLRQKIGWFLDNPSRMRGFTDEEIEMMRKIERGGKVENIARLLSKLGPSHPITGWGTAMAELAAFGSPASIVTLGTGSAAQALSEAIPSNKINRLEEAIRRRSSLERPPPERNAADEIRRAILRGGMQGAVPGLIQTLGQQQ